MQHTDDTNQAAEQIARAAPHTSTSARTVIRRPRAWVAAISAVGILVGAIGGFSLGRASTLRSVAPAFQKLTEQYQECRAAYPEQAALLIGGAA